MEKARPKAQEPEAKKPTSTETAAAIRGKVTLRITKDQEYFSRAAETLASALGWEGDPSWVLNGIQVSDARRFLQKTLHEVHVAALNDREPPTPAAVAAHLGLDPMTPEIASALKACWELERGQPATPTS
jgi:hypothetical protein